MVASNTNLGANTAQSMRWPRCTDTFAAERNVRAELRRSVSPDSRSMASRHPSAAPPAAPPPPAAAAAPATTAPSAASPSSLSLSLSSASSLRVSTPGEVRVLNAGDERNSPSAAAEEGWEEEEEGDTAAAARGRARAASISVPNVLRKSSNPPILKSNSSNPGREEVCRGRGGGRGMCCY